MEGLRNCKEGWLLVHTGNEVDGVGGSGLGGCWMVTHIVSEGFHEKHNSGQLLRAGDHKGVRLKVNSCCEVNCCHPLVGHGKGCNPHHYL